MVMFLIMVYVWLSYYVMDDVIDDVIDDVPLLSVVVNVLKIVFS